MFKIGDFSKLSRVSIKALRLYDEAGLLKPSKVDEYSGFRYYAAEQMPRLNRILALKDLGFTLDQIGRILNEGLSAEQIRGMLILRQEEIRTQIEADQERLARVEIRLRQIEEEKSMSKYEPILKTTTPVKVMTLRRTIPSYHSVGPLMTELWNYAQSQGAKLCGPGMAVYYDPDYKEKDVDVEVALPIANSIPETAEIKVKEFPSIQVISIIHQGPYITLSEAYAFLMKWMGECPYRIVGPNQEIYLDSPGSCGENQDKYVTEIQIPVEKK